MPAFWKVIIHSGINGQGLRSWTQIDPTVLVDIGKLFQNLRKNPQNTVFWGLSLEQLCYGLLELNFMLLAQFIGTGYRVYLYFTSYKTRLSSIDVIHRIQVFCFEKPIYGTWSLNFNLDKCEVIHRHDKSLQKYSLSSTLKNRWKC